MDCYGQPCSPLIARREESGRRNEMNTMTQSRHLLSDNDERKVGRLRLGNSSLFQKVKKTCTLLAWLFLLTAFFQLLLNIKTRLVCSPKKYFFKNTYCSIITLIDIFAAVWSFKSKGCLECKRCHSNVKMTSKLPHEPPKLLKINFMNLKYHSIFLCFSFH